MNKENEKVPQYLPPKIARVELGVTSVTLRNWAIQGKIDCIITPGGRYLYDVEGFKARAKAATAARLKREAAKMAVKQAEDRKRRAARKKAIEACADQMDMLEAAAA